MKKENKKWKNFFRKIFYFFLFFSIIFLFYLFLISAPRSFSNNKSFLVNKGDNLISVSKKLEEEGIIKFSWVFRIALFIEKIKKNDLKILAGKYEFEKNSNIWEILKKIKSGEFLREYKSFTIFEGEPNYLIAKRLAGKMKNIDEQNFLNLAKEYEGMLYPDTYNLDLNFDEKEALNFFLKNFEKKIKENNLEIPKEKLKEILTIASLVEAEAGSADFETKRHVAGVIENRLKLKMPLQLDYVFFYILKKDRKKMSQKEIANIIWRGKRTNSKFNNYKYPGLPPNPINNPSIDSIKAALNPLKTKDLFYITGKDGKFYFAETNREHNRNIKKYLK